MIRSKDVNAEVYTLEKILKDSKTTDNQLLRGLVKACLLAVKLVRDIRSNQVLELEKNGVIKKDARYEKK